MKSVSVIICAYNEENTVGKVLIKLKKLEYVTEIIVVDNGSTDSTYSILVKAKKDDNRIKILKIEKNKGLGLGLQLAIILLKFLITV